MPRVLTYLACPYSHHDPAIRRARFEIACRVAGLLMNRGKTVFSPISHTHPIAIHCNLALGWGAWEKFDTAYLTCSKEMYVLTIKGWVESTGVQSEIAIAKKLNIPITYIDEHGNKV